MAIISKPETSLARSGIFSSASENTTGNMLPAPNPVIKIEARATRYTGDITIPAIPVRATTEVSSRNDRGFIQLSRMAPDSRAIVSPAKNTLMPITAVSSVTSNRSVRITAMFVLMATSAPTIRKIESAITATKRFFNKPKQDRTVAGFLSGRDSSMGVNASQADAASEVMQYTANTSFQLPVDTASQEVSKGPANDITALRNCPVLRKLGNLPDGVTSCNNGFADTWMRVLPIPSNKNEINIIAKE